MLLPVVSSFDQSPLVPLKRNNPTPLSDVVGSAVVTRIWHGFRGPSTVEPTPMDPKWVHP